MFFFVSNKGKTLCLWKKKLFDIPYKKHEKRLVDQFYCKKNPVYMLSTIDFSPINICFFVCSIKKISCSNNKIALLQRFDRLY